MVVGPNRIRRIYSNYYLLWKINMINTCPQSTLLVTVKYCTRNRVICFICCCINSSSSQILVFFVTGKDVKIWISFRSNQAMTQWIIIFSLLAGARTKQFQVYLSMFISLIVCIGDQGLSVYLKITQSQGWFTKKISAGTYLIFVNFSTLPHY